MLLHLVVHPQCRGLVDGDYHRLAHEPTPDEMRGRVSSVNSMFIGSSNELGAFESGIAARLMGTAPSVVFGGCMTLLVVAITYFKAPKIRTLSFKDHP